MLLAYNPGLVGATDIPDAWHSRFPATLEVSSNWAALAEFGAPAPLVGEAMRLDHQRIAGEDGLSWTPQFRDIESLWRMAFGDRAALAFFASNLHEQVQAGKIQDAEAAAACRDARPGRLRPPAGLRVKWPAEPARLPAGRDLMTPAGGTPTRPAVFVQQLHRAAAQRGRLDPVYQDLSDHWTAILQRLYPVWALIGPGLSDPGHIEIHSRTVYLDSETLLGFARRDRHRSARTAGGPLVLRRRAARDDARKARQAVGNRARLRAVGVQRPARPAGGGRPAAARGAAVEAPRRARPSDSLRGRFVRRALQAAVADVILPAFTGQVLEAARAACQPLTRDLAARADRLPASPYPVRDRRPGRPDRVGRAVACGGRRTPTSARSTTSTRNSCGSPMASSSGSTRRPASTGESSASPTPHRRRRSWRARRIR